MYYNDDFSDKTFGDCGCCTKMGEDDYCEPIFGVGGIHDTHIFSTSSRPLKFTLDAIEHYSIPDTELENYSFLNGKTVSVVRRIVKNNEKINEYHYPKYKVIEILHPYMWRLALAKIQCLNTGEIEENINIARIAIPSLINKPINETE